MRLHRHLPVVAGITLIASAALTAPAQAETVTPAAGLAGRYVVVLEDGVAAPAEAVAELAGLPGVELTQTYSHALHGFAATLPSALAATLAADPRVAFVDEDRAVDTQAQSTPTGVDRAEADLSPTAAIDGAGPGVDVDVAVIDTGIADHPDLHLVRSVDCSVGLPLLGGSCREGSPHDGNGHGTHVAGTIGAIDDDDDVVGVAPGARLWGVKVLTDAGSGTSSGVIAGIDWVTAHADEIEVANMSLGGAGTDDGLSCAATTDAYKKAVCGSVAAGVTYAVAAGNDSEDASQSVPAAYDDVITVSALADFDGAPGGRGAATCRADVDDTLADYSNYGADVDLIAPGTCITSTWPPLLDPSGQKTISGTSMASPHVAGAAALYKALNPGATPAQVRAALVAAGSSDWDASDDPDGTQEPLLDVSGL